MTNCTICELTGSPLKLSDMLGLSARLSLQLATQHPLWTSSNEELRTRLLRDSPSRALLISDTIYNLRKARLLHATTAQLGTLNISMHKSPATHMQLQALHELSTQIVQSAKLPTFSLDTIPQSDMWAAFSSYIELLTQEFRQSITERWQSERQQRAEREWERLTSAAMQSSGEAIQQPKRPSLSHDAILKRISAPTYKIVKHLNKPASVASAILLQLDNIIELSDAEQAQLVKILRKLQAQSLSLQLTTQDGILNKSWQLLIDQLAGDALSNKTLASIDTPRKLPFTYKIPTSEGTKK